MLGPGTGVISGERFPLQTRAAWQPIAWGPSAQVTPLPQMSIPPVVGATGVGVTTGTGSMPGTGAANLNAAAAAAAAPFNMKLSPVLWAVGFLLIGLIGLRVIHWR